MLHPLPEQQPDDYPQTGSRQEQTITVLDADEFALFCKNIRNKLYCYFSSRVENNEDAEDLTMEVLCDFIKAVKHQGTVISWEALTWKIASNVKDSFYRHKSRSPQMASLEELSELLTDGGSHRSVEETMVDLVDEELLFEVIKKLPSLEQKIIALRRIGYKFVDIAKLVGGSIPEKTVRNKYNKAVRETLPRLIKLHKK